MEFIVRMEGVPSRTREGMNMRKERDEAAGNELEDGENLFAR